MSADPEPQTEAIDPVGHIVRTPGTVGGRRRIAGTRIRVAHVAGWYIEGGMSIAEMLVQFPASPRQTFMPLSPTTSTIRRR